MTEKFYSIITQKGIELINQALSDGKKINLEYIAVGDSNGSYYEPDSAQLKLVNEVYRAKVYEVTNFTARAQIPNSVGGFYIREIGLFDDNNNLILVAKQPENYKPVISEGTSKETWLKILIQAIDSDAIELKVDTSIKTVTVEYVSNLINLHTHKELMPIAVYDTNYNGKVDTCEYIDGGTFADGSGELETSENIEDLINANLTSLIPEGIMDSTKYDTNNNGIVDNAENIDAGEF